MNPSTTIISPRAVGITALFLIGLTGLPALAGDSVGRVSVMDVDDVRDAATIARAKALNRSQSSGEDGEGSFSSGCSDLNIGNVKTGVGQPVPRNVTIVIEGPVVQENNCR